jgi:hypothetical protein
MTKVWCWAFGHECHGRSYLSITRSVHRRSYLVGPIHRRSYLPKHHFNKVTGSDNFVHFCQKKQNKTALHCLIYI